jgi:hypothetical protein
MSLITDGTSLQNAKDQQGNPVLPANIDAGTTDGVATRAASVHNAGTKCFAPTTSGNTFVAIESPKQVSARGLSTP